MIYDGLLQAALSVTAQVHRHAELRPSFCSLLVPGGLRSSRAHRLCRGFLNVSKVALDKAVDCIFEDKGSQDLLKNLFCSKDWLSGVTTHSVLLTLEDYLGDLKEWLDAPFYKRAVTVRASLLAVCGASLLAFCSKQSQCAPLCFACVRVQCIELLRGVPDNLAK